MPLQSVERYLQQLPDGFASYPLAMAKSSVVRPWLEGAVGASLRVVADLPAPLRRLLDAPPPVNTWVSEVSLAALILAAHEVHFTTSGALQDYIRVTNRAAFKSPLYRILFEVLSTELLLKGAAQRWSAFHRGSTLAVAETGPGQCILDLSHPPHIFADPSLHGHGTSFALAAELAGAKSVTMEYVARAPDRTRYVVRWR